MRSFASLMSEWLGTVYLKDDTPSLWPVSDVHAFKLWGFSGMSAATFHQSYDTKPSKIWYKIDNFFTKCKCMWSWKMGKKLTYISWRFGIRVQIPNTRRLQLEPNFAILVPKYTTWKRWSGRPGINQSSVRLAMGLPWFIHKVGRTDSWTIPSGFNYLSWSLRSAMIKAKATIFGTARR